MDKETLENKISEIKTLREIKGKEEETFQLIEDLKPKVLDDPNALATLNWETALVWQHIVMEEAAKEEREQDAQVIEEAKTKMAAFANTAHQIVVDNNLDRLGYSYRFLGRVADYDGDYRKALENYGKALGEFGVEHHPSLEVRAFIAFSTVMNGDAEEGLNLARKVHDDFKNSEVGRRLKEEDYFKWAVWMSGIAPRQLFALKETGAEYDEEEMRAWLEETKNELENPSGEVTWGDDKFQFRIDELNKALSVVSLFVLTAAKLAVWI